MTTRQRNWDLPAREFARRETLARLERILAEVSRISQSAGEEEVHDLRVSIRRFSQAVRIFAPLIPKRARKIVKQVHGLLQAAGTVRDLDVGMERLGKLGVADDEPLLIAMNESRRRAGLELLGEVFRLRSTAPEITWPPVFGAEEAREGQPS